MKTITIQLPESALQSLFKFLQRVDLRGHEAPEFISLLNLLHQTPRDSKPTEPVDNAAQA